MKRMKLGDGVRLLEAGLREIYFGSMLNEVTKEQPGTISSEAKRVGWSCGSYFPTQVAPSGISCRGHQLGRSVSVGCLVVHPVPERQLVASVLR
jgi:hypothetical protein